MIDNINTNLQQNQIIDNAKMWITKTNTVSITAKAGRYGGTYAHKDTAFEFASAINPASKLYLIKEFQRLKEDEQKKLGWCKIMFNEQFLIMNKMVA